MPDAALPELSEQARERATEIRTTTIWNGRGTADLLDALADEIDRKDAIIEAKTKLLTAYRTNNHRLADRALTLLEKLGA